MAGLNGCLVSALDDAGRNVTGGKNLMFRETAAQCHSAYHILKLDYSGTEPQSLWSEAGKNTTSKIHEGTCGNVGKAHIFLISALDGQGMLHTPTNLLPREKPWYILNRRQGGPSIQSGFPEE